MHGRQLDNWLLLRLTSPGHYLLEGALYHSAIHDSRFVYDFTAECRGGVAFIRSSLFKLFADGFWVRVAEYFMRFNVSI